MRCMPCSACPAAVAALALHAENKMARGHRCTLPHGLRSSATQARSPWKGGRLLKLLPCRLRTASIAAPAMS